MPNVVIPAVKTEYYCPQSAHTWFLAAYTSLYMTNSIRCTKRGINATQAVLHPEAPYIT